MKNERVLIMKKILMGIISILLVVSFAGCGTDNTTQVDEIKSSQVTLNKMQAVCELATLECFYHNTAKYKEGDKELWWNTTT